MTEAPAGKGRPTPKRSEQQRRRTGPVAPPPLTRKEASQRQKERARSARKRIKEGASAGDPRYLAKRDAGPVRALVRDTVDGRRNVGVLLLPLAVLLVLAQLVGNDRVTSVALLLWLTGVLAMVADVVVTTLAIRRAVRAAHPDEGRMVRHVSYGLLRSTVFRRFRLPPARTSPGRPRTP